MSRDAEGVEFLRWVLPRMGFAWSGFRNVRGQVLKRVLRRARALGLDDLQSYRAYIEEHPGEQARLEPLCRVTISRFFRDRGIFEELRDTVLPRLAEAARERGAEAVRCCAIGCASGEEPYTLALIDHFTSLELPLDILAFDADAQLLERARRATYARATLRELPADWIESAFDVLENGMLQLAPELCVRVRFEQLDIRRDPLPSGPFDVVFCRNLAFTYFDDDGRRRMLDAISERLVPGGALVLGSHEALPSDARFAPWGRCIHRMVPTP